MPIARRAACVALLCSFASACSATATDEPRGQPEGWSDEVALRVPVDLNPDPRVLEVNIEARLADIELLPGHSTTVWTYDGGVPGPLLRANVGDRLIVHFKNSLPEPTSVHWHGLRIPNDMDGVPDEPYPPLAPGETFVYDFVLPDAGTYWYHPHFASAAQVGNGLYGPLIVDDPSEPQGLGDEVVLMLSDASVGDDGTLHPADGGGEFGTLFGREGNLLLVNGKVLPSLQVRRGARQRWRLINAAKSRYYELGLAGNQFTRIGSDAGFIERPEQLDTLVLTPAQRADVVLEPTPPAGSDEVTLRWIAYNRGFGTSFNRPDEELMKLSFVDGAAVGNAPLKIPTRDIPPADPEGRRPIDVSLTVGKSSTGQLEMGINGVPASAADHIMTPLGERQLWTVKNTFDFDHPFHLHGYFFRVLDVNGAPPVIREWRDTVNVPVNATVRFLVDFDARPGMWMFHCHILDHADAGMMGMIHVR